MNKEKKNKSGSYDARKGEKKDVSRPLRVLHVTFNMDIGGTEQVIRQLVTTLPNEKFHNEIICIDGHIGEIGQLLEKDGIKVSVINRHPGIDFGLAKRLRHYIAQNNIDILHCHQYTPYFYGWLSTIGSKVKVVFTEHGRFHPDRYRFKALFLNPIMSMFTGRIVSISAATKEALVRYEFMPQSRIEVIYNGIEGFLQTDRAAKKNNLKLLGIDENDFVFGTVSRLDPIKNQELMLEAFAQYILSFPQSKLLIVGDGPSRNGLEAIAKKLNISSRVIFLGFQTDPSPYMALMDVFLLTSFTEGTSMTLLEAMSLGLPMIASRVGGTPEIIEDRKTGFLFEPSSVKQLIAFMIELKENENLRKQMGDEALATFKRRFTAQAMSDSYSNIYCSVARYS